MRRQMLVRINAGATATYGRIFRGDSVFQWTGRGQRYFTINWIQLAVSWAAFALFIWL
jgi:hypothetical protein